MRFSDFLLVSDPSDLDFIVGYTEEQNIRINVSDFFSGFINGSGNPGYIAFFTSANTIGNSQLFQDGSNIVIGGVNAMGYRLAVGGTIYAANGAVIETTSLGADALRVISEGENIFIIPNDLGQSITSSRRIIHPPAVLTTESATLGQLNTAITNLDNEIDILLALKVDKTSIGVPNGVASLDSGGKVPLSQIPDSIIGQVQYMGTWNAFTNTPTLNPLVPEERGHYYVVSTAGVFGGLDYQIGDWIISNGVIWEKVDNTDAVTSVFGRIGAILALESDYQSFYPRLSQTYDNPTWINTLAFSKITGVPAFLLENQTITLSGDVTGSGKTSITSTISNNAVNNEKLRDSLGTSVIGRSASTTGDPADIQATTDGHVLLRSAGNLLFGLISGDSISSIDWSKITGTPTTLSGYGITNAYTKTEADNKFVPYTGASANVNLGSNNITSNSFIKAGGTSAQFLKADGSVDTSQYIPTTRSVNAGTGLTGGGNLSSDITIAFDTTWGDNRYAYRTRQLTINGTTYDLSADRTWNVGTVNTLTTIGTSGPATLVGNTLNIPEYQGGVTSFNTRTGAVTLTSGDVTTALGYTPVPNARTLTINGVTYDLSANRSWTIASGSSARNEETFIATANQTTFTVTGGYTAGLVDIYVNGVKLTPSDYTATNGTTVVLAIGVIVGDIVSIINYVSSLYSLSATGPLNYNPTTAVLSISQANTTTNGYLSSTDWTTFNGKQNVITLTTTGTSGVATLIGSTLNIPNYSTDLSGYVTLGTTQTITGAKTFETSTSTFALMDSTNANGGVLSFRRSGTNVGHIGNSAQLGAGVLDAIEVRSGTGRSVILKTDGGSLTLASAGNVTLSGPLGAPSAIFTFSVTAGGVYLSSNDSLFSTQATISKHSVNGLALRGTTGSSFDFSIFSANGTALITNPTGTANLSLSGGVTLTGALNGTSAVFTGNVTSEGLLKVGNISSANNSIIAFANTANFSPRYFYYKASDGSFNFTDDLALDVVTITEAGAATFSSSVTANSLIKSGGTSSQFLKADGSVDSSTYLTTTNATSTYVPYTGATQDVDLGVNTLTSKGLNVDVIAGQGGALNLRQATNFSTWTGAPYTSIYAIPGNRLVIMFSNDNRQITLDGSIVSASSPRTFTFPDASGTIALVGGTGVGTVTSVAALTLGTSGTDLSSTVVNGTTTPVITLNVPDASSSARGVVTTGAQNFAGNKSFQNTIFANAGVRLDQNGTALPTFVQNISGTGLSTTGANGVGFNNSNNFFFSGSDKGCAVFVVNNTGTRNYTLQDASGTLAFTSDIPSLAGYVTLATDQTITGLKTIVRSGDVLSFKIGTDNLYGLKVFYSQNELVPSGEATWSFVSTFNNGIGTGIETTPISFFRGVLVTGQRLLSASVNANLLDYYGNNPSGRYPVYAYNTGVQQFASSIIVGETTGVVNPATGAIADLPSGVVANFKGRVIGSNAVSSNEFATLGQITSYVPYSGATGAVNLGAYDLTVNGITVGRGGGSVATNTAIGASALSNNISGIYNTAIGNLAGQNIIGSYNTIIGGYGGSPFENRQVILSTGDGFISYEYDFNSNTTTLSGNVYPSSDFSSSLGNINQKWDRVWAAGVCTVNPFSSQYFIWTAGSNLTLSHSIYGGIAQISESTGIYTPLSDKNKKKDFEKSTIGLNAILGLKPTLFRMKSQNNDDAKSLGFIAQEVKDFIPQAYVESGEEENKFIGLQDRPIVAALVKGMQEQQDLIEALTARLTALENK